VGQRGRTLYFQIKPSILGSLHIYIYLFIYNDGLIGLLPRKTNRRHNQIQNTIFNDHLSDLVHGSQIHPETFIFLQMLDVQKASKLFEK